MSPTKIQESMAPSPRGVETIDDRTLGRLLDRVERPARYIGGELYQAKKDPTAVAGRICLAFPDAYEIGMSHLGLRILYACLNREPELLAERVYCPFPDLEQALRTEGVPLFSMETRTPLHAFPVVGFSLQSELTITNVLTMLDLGRIPLGRVDRTEHDPLVIAGGPVVFNPEPTTDFFDAYLVGDGEEELPHFLRREAELRQAGVARAERLARLASEVEGLYVPALYPTRVHPDTGLIHVTPSSGAPFPIRKALLQDLDRFPFPADTLVPRADIIHDRVAVEIARGCTEGCRFCQAGIIYRPVRERSPRSIVNTIVEGLDRSGFDEASLTALSTADYSCVTPLARVVMAELETRRVALSVSSLRVYGVTEELAREIARGRKTGFTIAPEAGTQRLRDVINKGITDEDIRTAAEIAFGGGWNRIKIYFMIGLPTETDEDVAAIADAVRTVHEIGRRLAPGRVQVVVSVSSFVPKASAAFQWAAFDGVENLRRKQALLRDRMRRIRTVELKLHDVHVSRLEAVLARGDRRLGRVIEHAWRAGARFDEWSDHFDPARWGAAFEACDVDPGRYLGALATDTDLPWDHIHSRVEKSHLARDMARGLEARPVPPCEKPSRVGRRGAPQETDIAARLVCHACGMECDLEAIAGERARAAEEAQALLAEKPRTPVERGMDRPAGATPFSPTPGPLYRFRVAYAKQGLARYLAHLETVRLIDRAGQRIAWPVAYTGGFHPHTRLAFGPALSVGVASEAEYFDVELTEAWEPEVLRDRLNATLHEGFSVQAVRRIPEHVPPIEAAVERLVYRVEIPAGSCGGAETLREAVEARRTSGAWPIERIRRGRTRTFDACAMVVGSEVEERDGSIVWRVTLQEADGRWVKPRELLESLQGGWPDGAIITREWMGRVVDGRPVTPLEVESEPAGGAQHPEEVGEAAPAGPRSDDAGEPEATGA